MAQALPPNIVISGAFRSGTTFLFLAFPHAFADVVTNGRESKVLETELPAKYKWRVSKSPNDIHQVRIIHERLDPFIIYMLRDPRDSIVSWKKSKNDYHLSYNEWQRNLLFAESSKSQKMIFVRFEDMIQSPDRTQEYLMARIEGLEKKHALSECHRYMDEDSPIAQQLSHDSGPERTGEKARPMDSSVIGTWIHDKERIRDQLARFPELQATLEKYGYEQDDEWQKLLR
ncbi:MAG: hypothetical protein ABIH23_28135 [bacterium]